MAVNHSNCQYIKVFTVVYKAAKCQSFTNRSCCRWLWNSVVQKLRKKAGRAFSHSSVFSAKFPDICRFCGHPELLHLRKINWDNSLSLVPALCGRMMTPPPWLNTLSIAVLDAGSLNALSAGRYSLLSETRVWLCCQNVHMATSTEAWSTSTCTKYYMSGHWRHIIS